MRRRIQPKVSLLQAATMDQSHRIAIKDLFRTNSVDGKFYSVSASVFTISTRKLSVILPFLVDLISPNDNIVINYQLLVLSSSGMTKYFLSQKNMFDSISSARGKLDDPLILNWALRYYKNLPQNALTRRKDIENEWFHDVFIARSIDQGETEALLTLFHLLPEQRLAVHTYKIIQHWSMWSTALAGSSTPILAKHAPHALLQLIEAQLQHMKQGNLDAMMRFLDLRWLDTIEQKQSFAPVFDRIIVLLLALPEEDLGRSFFLSSLLRASGVLSAARLVAVLNVVLNNIERKNGDERFFNSLFYGLFGQTEYLDLVFAHTRNESQQSVTALAPFFVADAPLALFDEWLASPPAFAQIESVLEQAAQHSDGCSKFMQLFQSLSKRGNALSDTDKTKLGIAACLHGYA